MLTTLVQKLCPLLSLAALAIGCGKKIEDASAPTIRNIENQEPSSLLILRLQGSHYTYPANRFGSYKIPSELKVNSGNTAGKLVSITYDLDSNGAYQMKCTYRGNSAGNRILLTKCVDDLNQDYGPVDRLLDATFYVHPKNYIRLQNTTHDLDVEAIYQMTWG